MVEYNDPFKINVEEWKELGHEYRYREQIMVQHFSISMVAVAAMLNIALREPTIGVTAQFLLQAFGAAFLPLVALHLRNINQDRLAALTRKEVLRIALEFGAVHQGVNGKERPSAMRLIVWFAIATSLTWWAWFVKSVVEHVLTACVAR